jgi:hypothetical protein
MGDQVIKKLIVLLSFVVFVSLVSACSSSIQGQRLSSASWAEGRGITFQHVLYAGTDEKVDKVGKKLGSILKFSRMSKMIPRVQIISRIIIRKGQIYI